jgi:hypothetical protein
MKLSVSLTTEKDKHLPAFDYTKLTALNTCPRWGLIRYDQHKRMPGSGRNLPIEIGSTAHKGFAAIRLMELMEAGHGENDLVHQKGLKEFGEERWLKLVAIYSGGDNFRDRVQAGALYIINTAGFTDDPGNRRKTLSNLEASMIAYIQRSEFGKRIPYIDDKMVGVEVPFDLTLTFNHMDARELRIRYIGKIDGIVTTPNGIEIEENKTTSGLSVPWMDGFLISHQVTGYCMAVSTLLNQPVRDVVIRGLMVPLPKNYDLQGVANVPVSRDRFRFTEWARWVWHTVNDIWLPFHEKPLEAPEYSHSCYRYFGSCPFIPLCGMASPEDRQLTFEQMEHDEWSPLHEEASNG